VGRNVQDRQNTLLNEHYTVHKVNLHKKIAPQKRHHDLAFGIVLLGMIHLFLLEYLVEQHLYALLKNTQ